MNISNGANRRKVTAGARFSLFVAIYAIQVAGLMEVSAQQSLRVLEQRALLAQSLAFHVEVLEGRLDALREEKRELEEEAATLRAERDTLAVERDELRKEVASLQREQNRMNQLLVMFRSGDFEYYEVREGDTTKSIAANPMVYGDAGRSIWIEHANSLDASKPLVPGTVLVIPRFSRGVTHDL